MLGMPHPSAEDERTATHPKQTATSRLPSSGSVEGRCKPPAGANLSSTGSRIEPLVEDDWTIAAIKERLAGMLWIPFENELRDMISQHLEKDQRSLPEKSWIQDKDDIILFHDGIRLECNSSQTFERMRQHRFGLLVPILNVIAHGQKNGSYHTDKIQWELCRGPEQLTPVVLKIHVDGQFHLHHYHLTLNTRNPATDLISITHNRLPRYFGRRTPKLPWTGPSLLEEIPKDVNRYSIFRDGADIVRFKLFGDRPEDEWTWYSYSPCMSIESGILTGADLRMHVARRLGFDPRKTGLLFTGNFGPHFELCRTVRDCHVKDWLGRSECVQGFIIVLNPSPQFMVFGKFFELDLSGKCDLKFSLKVREYREWIASALHIDGPERIQIYFENQELEDDSKSLGEINMSREARIGWKPILFNIEVKSNNLRSCIICAEDLPTNKFLKEITESCQHPVNICHKCLQQSIRVDLESRGWDVIRCPECRVAIQHADVQRCAMKQDFEM
jgi:hypothetical protein